MRVLITEKNPGSMENSCSQSINAVVGKYVDTPNHVKSKKIKNRRVFLSTSSTFFFFFLPNRFLFQYIFIWSPFFLSFRPFLRWGVVRFCSFRFRFFLFAICWKPNYLCMSTSTGVRCDISVRFRRFCCYCWLLLLLLLSHFTFFFFFTFLLWC